MDRTRFYHVSWLKKFYIMFYTMIFYRENPYIDLKKILKKLLIISIFYNKEIGEGKDYEILSPTYQGKQYLNFSHSSNIHPYIHYSERTSLLSIWRSCYI